jgi:hypothetical protein
MIARTSINRLPAAVVIAGSVLANSMVCLAGQPHDYSVRRQFVVEVWSCMKKRMADDRSISYNHAFKACKAQVAGQQAGSQQAGSQPAPLVAAEVAADGKH